MNKPYTIFRDSTGRLQATAGSKGSVVVTDFLMADIRENASHCDAVLDLLERCLDDQDAGREDSVGNIYRLTVEDGEAVLANIHDGQAPGARIPALELLEVLEEWRSHF